MPQREAQWIVTFGRRLHERGFVSATDGNLSARLPGGGFLATPSGLPKAEITESSLALLDDDGRQAGGRAPSSEWPMHRAIYRARPDVGAVVHAHPPFSTTLACAGISLDRPLLSEAAISLGPVPLVPFALPSSQDLADGVAKALEKGCAALLANHGAVTVGADLRAAYYRMETLEQAAKIDLFTRLLGRESPLPPPAVKSLEDMGRRYALASLPSPSCEGCPAASGEEGVFLRKDQLAALLADFARLYGRGTIG